LRQGAHNVENIARRLVPLTSASCKEDGSDWREMSVDVGQRSGALLDGARDRVGQTKKRLRIARRIIGHSELRAPATLSDALLPSISRQQHIPLSKEQAAARYPVTLDLAGSHPSVDGANLNPTQLRDFAFRQKLLTRAALVRHTASPPLDL